MTDQPRQNAAPRHCTPCEGGVPRLTPDQAREQLSRLTGWELSADGLRIVKHWQARYFRAAMEFLGRVAELAEQEGHHPDLHLENYRHVRIELWTHAVGGLTENDFILAEQIDTLPIELRRSKSRP